MAHTDYTHLLPDGHRQLGYTLRATDMPSKTPGVMQHIQVELHHPSAPSRVRPVGGIYAPVMANGEVGEIADDDDFFLHPQHRDRDTATAMTNALYEHASKLRVPSLDTQRTKKQLLDAAGGDEEALRDALRAEVQRRGLSDEWGIAPPAPKQVQVQDAAPPANDQAKPTKPKLGVVDGGKKPPTKPMKKSETMNKAKKEAASWLGRPVTNHEHIPLLNQAAATLEMGKDKLPQSEAEHKAYEDYVKDQRTQAAAWHLKGYKSAQGANDREAEEKHAIMYAMHCKALGYEPVGQPHASIVAHMEKHPEKLYRFKAHRGDLFALPDGNKGAQEPTKMDKAELVGRHEIGYQLLKSLKSVLKKMDQEDHWAELTPAGKKNVCSHDHGNTFKCPNKAAVMNMQSGKSYCMSHAKQRGYNPKTEK